MAALGRDSDLDKTGRPGCAATHGVARRARWKASAMGLMPVGWTTVASRCHARPSNRVCARWFWAFVIGEVMNSKLLHRGVKNYHDQD